VSAIIQVRVAFHNDGKTAYVTNAGDDSISVIDVKTGTVQGAPIVVGDIPSHWHSARTVKGRTSRLDDDTVSVINVKTATVHGDPIRRRRFP